MEQAIAANLYESVSITVDRFHAHVVCKSKVQLLGFADISLTIPSIPGFAMKFRGLEVKVLNGKPRIDTPSERSKGAGDTQYFPIYFPKSAEMRAVLTARVFETQEVRNAIATAEQMRSSASAEGAQTGSNPFAGTTQVPAEVPAGSAAQIADAQEVAKHLAAAGFSQEQIDRAVAELS